MKLSLWLERENISAAAFAGRIGVSRQSLHRYCTGERRPEWATIPKIISETGGAVTADDFLQHQDTEQA